VENYSKSKLTFGKDKLVAISGVAKQMLKMWKGHPEDYLAGLWRDILCTQLLWLTTPPSKNSREEVKPSYYRAPSWSWASVDLPVNYKWTRVINQSLHLVQVLDLHMTPLDHLCTSILSDYIRLRRPLCRLTVSRPQEGTATHDWGSVDGV
jgi:hypothetical protein